MITKDEAICVINALKRQHLKWFQLYMKLDDDILDQICKQFDSIDDFIIYVEEYGL